MFAGIYRPVARDMYEAHNLVFFLFFVVVVLIRNEFPELHCIVFFLFFAILVLNRNEFPELQLSQYHRFLTFLIDTGFLQCLYLDVDLAKPDRRLLKES